MFKDKERCESSEMNDEVFDGQGAVDSTARTKEADEHDRGINCDDCLFSFISDECTLSA